MMCGETGKNGVCPPCCTAQSQKEGFFTCNECVSTYAQSVLLIWQKMGTIPQCAKCHQEPESGIWQPYLAVPEIKDAIQKMMNAIDLARSKRSEAEREKELEKIDVVELAWKSSYLCPYCRALIPLGFEACDLTNCVGCNAKVHVLGLDPHDDSSHTFYLGNYYGPWMSHAFVAENEWYKTLFTQGDDGRYPYLLCFQAMMLQLATLRALRARFRKDDEAIAKIKDALTLVDITRYRGYLDWILTLVTEDNSLIYGSYANSRSLAELTAYVEMDARVVGMKTLAILTGPLRKLTGPGNWPELAPDYVQYVVALEDPIIRNILLAHMLHANAQEHRDEMPEPLREVLEDRNKETFLLVKRGVATLRRFRAEKAVDDGNCFYHCLGFLRGKLMPNDTLDQAIPQYRGELADATQRESIRQNRQDATDEDIEAISSINGFNATIVIHSFTWAGEYRSTQRFGAGSELHILHRFNPQEDGRGHFDWLIEVP